jgi:hypothetical protein
VVLLNPTAVDAALHCNRFAVVLFDPAAADAAIYRDRSL